MRISLLSLATFAALSLHGPLPAHAAAGTDVLYPALAGDAEAAGGARQAAAGITAARFGTWGIDTAGMQPGVRPGEDFFAFVSGSWERKTAIPADQSNYGSFLQLRQLSEARVRRLVEGYPEGDPASDGDGAKIAALYRGFLAESQIEELGSKPLRPLLAAIVRAGDKADLAALMGRSQGAFGGSFFDAAVSDDQRDPDRNTLYLSQGGLGLGDRQLYLEERFAPQRERYQAYVAQMLALAGWAGSDDLAGRILALETAMAQVHWSRAESRDRDRTYNPVEIDELPEQAPGFPWPPFFDGAGLGHAERAVLRQDSAFPKLARIFAEAELDTLKAWLAFHTTDAAAPLLASAFADAHFEFRSRFLSGQPEQRERWKRGVEFVERAMGEAIGRDYVALYFPPDAKAKMDALVANVKVAMGERLRQLDWMGEATRDEALAKLDNFGLKIGHPERWRDYSGLAVVPGDLFGNALRARDFHWRDRAGKVGQPVDKDEWGMTPQTVNAYYSPVKNEIVFPAAILQPPFFDPAADPAVNYGAIGAVIGHEIIHGFDDQGRKSDGKGLLRDWWASEDAARFEAQATRLGAQYEAYEFAQLPGMHINAQVAMGENIADLGGLTIALEAYRRSLGDEPAPVLDGFTGEQRFFMGWAQVWRIKWRDDALRQQLVNGPHSPGQIRAFAPVRNIDAWYQAFDVAEDDALYIAPEKRVRLW